MSKSLFMLAAAALLAPLALQAQTVNVSATVANNAWFTGTQDLDFGTLTQSGATVDPTTAAAGNRTLHYNYGLTVGFSGVPTDLQDGSGNSLGVNLTCNVQDPSGTWGSTTGCNGASFALAAPAAVATAVVGIGGTISAAAVQGALPGTYTGTITITVAP